MSVAQDAEAIVTFLPTEHGGRQGPVFGDYRPQFYYNNHDWDARHTYPDVQSVSPGDTVRVLLSFLSPDAHWGKLQIGSAFLIREGQKVVGYGSIIKLLELEASAKKAAAKNG